MTGHKYDKGKPPIWKGLLAYFPRALQSVAEVSAVGAAKYAWNDWLNVPDGHGRYTDALGRHLLQESITAIDDETGCLHAAHIAWNALARLELMLLVKAKKCAKTKS